MASNKKCLIHDPKSLISTKEVEVAYCKQCKRRGYFRKGFDGRDDPNYGSFFRRDTLQPTQNLYYKIYPGRMNIDHG